MIVAKEYISDYCDKNGKIKDSNISIDQQKAMKELKRRVEVDNLVIYETDKTGKFVIDSLENMENKMKKHFENDDIIDGKDNRKIEKKLNLETDAWIEFLQLGKNVNQ